MKARDAIRSGLIGTSAMTLFSYLVSESKSRNFKEPELLAALLDDFLPEEGKNISVPLGWTTHFGLGIVWAFVFRGFYQNTNVKPNIKSALILGGISGLTAVAIWKLTFKNHPQPPQIPFTKYYRHLFLAHVVYSLSATLFLPKK